MANNYFSQQNPTDISIQSEDGGGMIFTKQGKFLFGAKLPEINQQLNEEFYQGNVDIDPNTNSSFIGIMNSQSEPINIDISSNNQYSLFSPPENNIVMPDSIKNDCDNLFTDASSVLLNWENDNTTRGNKTIVYDGNWDPYGANGTGIKNGDLSGAQKYFLNNFWNTNNKNTGKFSISDDGGNNKNNPKLLIKNLPSGLNIMAAQFNYNAKQWWTRILAAVGEDGLDSDFGVPYRLTPNLGPNDPDSYEYLLKDGTKSGKFVYNPYKVQSDSNKEFTIKGDERIQLFITNYDDIIDLYKQDKEKFLSALKDETIRYYIALDGDKTDLLKFHKEYVEKAYKLALKYKDCPDPEDPSTAVAPTPTPTPSSILPTPTLIPQVSPTNVEIEEEIEEGIYEANFLPESDDPGAALFDSDYGSSCELAVKESLFDISKTGVGSSGGVGGGLPPDLSKVDLIKDIDTYIQFSDKAKKDWINGVINPNVILDLIGIGKATQIKIFLGTARNGHSCKTSSGNISRHMKGFGVDLAGFYDLTGKINPSNKMITSPGNTIATTPANFKTIADKFVASAMKLPGASRTEAGNQRGILWYFNETAKGGNHFNHVHYSNNIPFAGWGTKSIPSSFNCDCNQIKKAKLKADNC